MAVSHRTQNLVIGKDGFTGSGLVFRQAMLGCVVDRMAHAAWVGMEYMFTVKDLR